ncbi:MAG: FkbM family methyltransferase [Planctomycetes bacterium]|nr:FkbM family methyltransferase [Planctomycetota bacterium]
MTSVRFRFLVQSLFKRFGYRLERVTTPPTLNLMSAFIRLLVAVRPNPFFLQIGANDGVRGDPLADFIRRYQFRGILVEPQPVPFQKLVANYSDQPGLIFENCAIDRQDGTATLYTTAGLDVVASFDRRFVRRHVSDSEIQEIQVPTARLESLLTKHQIQRIDLLQIDVEGFDAEILRMFPFDRLKPALVHYEQYLLSNADRSSSVALLEKHGYGTLSTGMDVLAFREASLE